MKLSGLYTEDLRLENKKLFDNLKQYTTKMLRRARTSPHPREARIRLVIKEIFQEVWGDYYDNPKALRRIESYKNSIIQHIPEFLKIQSMEDLRKEIETLFRSRAERTSTST